MLKLLPRFKQAGKRAAPPYSIESDVANDRKWFVLMHVVVTRSRDQKVLDTMDVLVDVGSVYNPSKHRYACMCGVLRVGRRPDSWATGDVRCAQVRPSPARVSGHTSAALPHPTVECGIGVQALWKGNHSDACAVSDAE
jgi:hypothetical protein